MLTDELGKRFLRVFIDNQDISILKKYGIDESAFIEDGLKGFRAVLEYLDKHGRWITDKELFDVTSLILPQADENIDHLAELLRKRVLSNHLVPYLDRISKAFDDRDPDQALAVFREAAYEVRDVSQQQIRGYFETAQERLDLWLSDKNRSEFEGILTPWPTLNGAIGGWVNGTLNVITAIMNTGKTWICCIVSNGVSEHGKNVLFVSLETPVARIERRLDALYTGIPFSAFINKSFTDEQKDLLKQKLSEKREGEIIPVDKKVARTVQDVVYLVKQYKPDAVVVDGGYRFEGRGKSSWESTVSIVNDLQYAAEAHNIPFIVSTQQGEPEKGKKSNDMSVWGVRYGKEWSINPDVVLGAFQNPDLRLLKAMELQIIKVRDSIGENVDPFRIQWNHSTMCFDEFPREETPDDSPTVSY